MHVRLLPLQNTQRHLAGDQNAESKMCHIAATIFVAGVAAIVADADIAMALATDMEVVFTPQQQQQPCQQQQRHQQKRSCNSGRGQLQQEWEQHNRQQWLSVGSVVAQLG